MSKDLIPPRLSSALLPFQREGLDRALAMDGRVLVGDEMGLGKTLQALAIAAAYSAEWPLLVVMPSSMRWAWVEEVERWLDALPLRPCDVNVVRDGKNSDILGKRVTLVTYPLCASKPILAQLQAANFQVVIADESHYMKNLQAKRTQAIVPILQAARRVILLSGTPALGRPVDLYPQLEALQPGNFGSFAAYGKKFCGGHRKPWGWDYSGATNLQELHRRLQGLMYRRLKKDVLTQLPAKRRQCIRVDLPSASPATKAALDMQKAVTDSVGSLRGGGWTDPSKIRELRGGLRRQLGEWYTASGRAKAETAMQFCAELLEGGVKLLVFAHHLEVLDALEQSARLMRVNYIRVDGSTPSQERHMAFSRFQADESVRCAVLSVTACGTGVTLTAASDVVFAELHWTPAVLQQAEDRCHRIGQAKSVNVRYIVGRGTSDEVMWPAIQRKLNVLGRTLDGTKDGGLRAEGVELTTGEAEGSSGSIIDDCIAQLSGGSSKAPSNSVGSQGASGASHEAAGMGVGGSERVVSLPSRPAWEKRQMVDKEDIRFFFGGGRPPKKPRAISNGGAAEDTQRREAPKHQAAPPPGSPEVIELLSDDDDGDCGGNRDGAPLVCDGGGGDDGGNGTEGTSTAIDLTEDAEEVVPGHGRGGGGDGGGGDGKRLPRVASDGMSRCIAEEPRTDLVGAAAPKDEKEGEGGGCNNVREKLLFDVSPHSGRVFVWSESASSPKAGGNRDKYPHDYLGISFMPRELLQAQDEEDVPKGLRGAPRLHQTALRFSREWVALKALDGSKLCGRWLRLPLSRALSESSAAGAGGRRHQGPGAAAAAGAAAASGAGGSTNRFARLSSFLDKQPRGSSGASSGGTLAASASAAASGGASETQRDDEGDPDEGYEYCTLEDAAVAQRWTPEGTPVCLVCSKEYPRDVRQRLGHAFCAEDCLREFWVKHRPGAARQQLFNLERGVCALCGLDAHGLFQQLMALPTAAERRRLLERNEGFRRVLGLQRLQRIAEAPRKGDLWQADHHVPVAEGGGEAGMDNYRTLCTACHQQETAALHRRLRSREMGKHAEGSKDIRGMFAALQQPSSR